MKNDKFAVVGILGILCIILFVGNGCVSSRRELSCIPPKRIHFISEQQKGIYHEIRKGETLWRIARLYNVPLSKIIEINNIENVRDLKIGDKIFIPGANCERHIKWQKEKKYGVAEGFLWPVRGKIVKRFGEPFKGVSSKGIIVHTIFNSLIRASISGKVILTTQRFPGLGKTIIIDSGRYICVYGYLNKINVRIGEKIRQGEIVGRTSDRLYFEVMEGDTSIDPEKVLP